MRPARAGTLVADNYSRESGKHRRVECRVVLGILCLLMAGAIPVHAGTFTVFGPKNYVRGTGAPVTVTDSFTVLNPATQYTLKAFNGGLQNSQTELVSSSVVTINGVQVLGPSNFNQNVSEVDVPVTLQVSNTISVQVRGQPGGTLTIQIVGLDNEPPTVTAKASPAPNAAGWNNTNVTVTFTCSDAISGIASCPPSQTVTTEGANQVISGTATDNAGNTASTSIKLNIDKTPPTISTASSPTPNGNGWNNSNVTVTFTCNDSLSGIGSCTPPATVSADGRSQVISGTAADIAGNTASASVTINLDKTPPTIKASASPASNAAGWNNSNVTVTFTCSDATSGVANCPLPQTVTTEGANQAISGTATDNAGNMSSTSVKVNIDKTPPTITATPSPVPNANGWNNSNVTVTFTCGDSLSGVANCPSPITVSTEGANQVISGTATDQAGNAMSASVTVNLDKTPPALTIASPANGAIVSTSAISVAGSVSDSLSGLSTVNCDGVSANVQGGSFSCSMTLVIGANTISVQAFDVAGNMTTQSETVTFVPPPVITLVNPSTGHQGEQNLLVTITGQFTHFAEGATTANFGSGITVVSLTVSGATSATALLSIDPAATVGARTVILTTGAEVVSLINGFSVPAGQLTLSVQPPISPTFQSSQVISGSLANGIGQTAVTIAGGASGVSQQLPSGQTQFGLSVPLRPNAENVLNVAAADASGQAASANNLQILQLTLTDLVKAQVTAQRLSTAEVKALVANGTINLSNPSNFNVSMFAVALTIGGHQASVSVPVISSVGDLFALGPPVTISCQAPGKDIEQNGNAVLVPCDNNGFPGPWNIGAPQIEVIPFELLDVAGTGASVPGILLIEGKIKTLKEFFKVNLLLMNVSSGFTLTNISAMLNVPDNGLSRVAPASGAITIDDLAAGSQGTGQFVIRGDVIGLHTVTVNFGASLSGPLLSTPIPISGSASTDVEVKGPPPLNVTVEMPASVTIGVPYTLKVNVQNASTSLDALYTSLELDLSGANVVDPTTGLPLMGPNIASLGNILAGQSVSQSYTV